MWDRKSRSVERTSNDWEQGPRAQLHLGQSSRRTHLGTDCPGRFSSPNAMSKHHLHVRLDKSEPTPDIVQTPVSHLARLSGM